MATYTVQCATTMVVGRKYPVVLTPDGPTSATVHIAASIGGGATIVFDNNVPTFDGSADAVTVYATPGTSGTVTLDFSNTGGLTDPADVHLTLLATAVVDRIAANLAVALRSATIRDDHPLTVERVNNQDQLYSNARDGLVVVFADPGAAARASDEPQGQMEWIQPFDLVFYLSISESAINPLDQDMAIRASSLLAAATADITRSNLAIDTKVDGGFGPYESLGGGLYAQRLRVTVRYRTYFNDPFRSITAPN